MSRRPDVAERVVWEPDVPLGYAEQVDVTVRCDRCRRPVAILKRAPLKLDQPYRVTVHAFTRPHVSVRARAGGWVVGCLERAGRGHPRYLVPVTEAKVRAVYDRAVAAARREVSLREIG